MIPAQLPRPDKVYVVDMLILGRYITQAITSLADVADVRVRTELLYLICDGQQRGYMPP